MASSSASRSSTVMTIVVFLAFVYAAAGLRALPVQSRMQQSYSLSSYCGNSRSCRGGSSSSRSRGSLLMSLQSETDGQESRWQSKVPEWLRRAAVTAGVIIGTMGAVVPPDASFAADTVKVGKCLLQSCQKELAECVLNPKCLANVICLNSCNGRSDEAECQIKCGDTFENEVVGRFNTCAVSQKKCVPQKQDEGEYPLPAASSMVKKFDTSIWNGRWYISAGLNKVFDIFDCQVHFFTSPYPGKFYAKLFWRITEPDGEFFTKNAIQRFVQDPKNPAHLINHDNDYLHYKDDWYVLDAEPNEFVLVYYRGSNDAWDGYGGAFLYTRDPTVKPELIPRLEKAVESMGLKYKWSDFTLTDNSCKEQTESTFVLREKYANRLLITEEQTLQEQLTAARYSATNELIKDEKGLEKGILNLEQQLEAYLKELGKDIVDVEKVLEKDVEVIEDTILKDLRLKK